MQPRFIDRFLRRSILVGLLIAAPAVAGAQGQPTTGETPDVEAFVRRALAQAPSLAAQRARVEAAQTSLRAAGTLPNPMVEFEYRDYNFPRYTIGSDPMSMAGASVRQNLMSKGRRDAEKRVAQAEIGLRRAEQDVVAVDLATEIRVEFARLFALDRERETLVNAQDLAAMLEATAQSRYAAGQTDQASVLRAQLERTRIHQRLVDIANERYAVQTAMNRLTNDPPDRVIGTIAELPAVDAPLPPEIVSPAASLETSLAKAPATVARQREVEMARTEVNSARQELRPMWTVGGGIYWQGGVNRTVTFNLGIELPWRKESRQRPLIAAAEQELRAAQFELQNTDIGIRNELGRLANEWRAAGEQIDIYQTAILPQNSAAFDATRSSYLAGRGDFVSVLEEFRRWIEVRTELASRQATRYTARVRIEGLLGKS